MKISRAFGAALALVIASVMFAPTAVAFADTTTSTILPLKVTTGGGAMSSTITSPTTNMWVYAADGTINDTATVSASVDVWVKNHAAILSHGAVNATRKLNKKKRKIVFTSAKSGWKLNQPAATAAITAALLAEAVETTPTSPVLALPTTAIKAKVTSFGKIILVVQSQRRIYLYSNMKVLKTYRCAVGQPAWPTPNGTFRIGKKVKWPTWRNGYASWSMHMPAYIGPSVNNPLGTRAMYVYKGNTDTGVRFHGVPHSEDPSIGHAASHGCLRMHRKDVEKFFNLVSVGTTVYIIK